MQVHKRGIAHPAFVGETCTSKISGMKKMFTLVLLALFSHLAGAQEVLINEKFNVTPDVLAPVPGRTWAVYSTGSYAGGFGWRTYPVPNALAPGTGVASAYIQEGPTNWDEILFTPFLNLTSGNAIEVSFYLLGEPLSGGTLSVVLSTGETISSITRTIQTITPVNNNTIPRNPEWPYTRFKVNFTVTSTGMQRIGFRYRVNSVYTHYISIDDVLITRGNNCSGTPEAGIASGPSAYSDDAPGFTLSHTNSGNSSGLIYQWQKNTGSGYTNMTQPGNSTQTLSNITQAVTTTYRLRTTCTNGGAISYSNPVEVIMNCAGAPAAGTAFGPLAYAYDPDGFTLTHAGISGVEGLGYQWQKLVPVFGWISLTEPGNTTPLVSNVTQVATTSYRMLTTCIATGLNTPSNTITVTSRVPPYAALPITERFETWRSVNSVRDVPNTFSKNIPSSGNRSARREDDAAGGNWTDPGGGTNGILPYEGSHSARFHTTEPFPMPGYSYFDFHFNGSGTQYKRIKYIEAGSGEGDQLIPQLSTDGGLTFNNLNIDTYEATGTDGWTRKTISFNTTSPTCIVRFNCLGNPGAFNPGDIFLDSLAIYRVPPCSVLPANVYISHRAYNSTCSNPSSGNAIMCLGKDIELSIVSPPAVEAGLSYVWQKNSLSTSGAWQDIPGSNNASSISYTIDEIASFRLKMYCSESLTNQASANTISVSLASAAECSNNDLQYLPTTLIQQSGAVPAKTYLNNIYAVTSYGTITSGCNWEYMNRNLWYSFTATAPDATINLSEISTINLFGIPATLNYALYSMPVFMGITDACGSINISGTNATQVLNGLTVGTTYKLRLGMPTCDVALSANIWISQPSFAANVTGTSLLCFGASTATATAAPTGGRAPYSYLWSNGRRTATISSLPAGTYSVTVTDAVGAIATGSCIVSQPDRITGTPVVTPISCFGTIDGRIEMNAAGGTAPYQFSTDGLSYQPLNVFERLAPATYPIRIRDNNNCVVTVNTAVRTPALLTASIGAVQPTCFGASTGSITLSVAGGTGARSYFWSGPAGFASLSSRPVRLAAGSYNVVVTDAKGCVARTSGVVTSYNEILANPFINPVTCRGGADGAINLVTTGGSGSGFRYAWTGPTAYASSVEDISGLRSGTYVLLLTDIGTGCVVRQSYVVNQPVSSVAVNATVTHITACGGRGSIQATATGGTGPYWYRIGSGADQRSGLFSSLPAGTYTITATAINGCTATRAVTVTDNGNDSWESNNSLATAKTIRVGAEVNARIGNATDEDWFRFATAAGTTAYTVSVLHATEVMNYNLFTASGVLVPPTSVVGQNKNYSLLPSAVYNVRVTGTSSMVCYSLIVNTTSPPGSRISGIQQAGLDILPETLTAVVYPNPHQGSFNISISSPVSGKASIVLYDLLGRTVAERIEPLKKGTNQVIFTGMKPSSYIFRATIQGYSTSGKILGIK
jgi:hypothetical protein